MPHTASLQGHEVFQVVDRNIKKLKARGIRFSLQTPLMGSNYGQINDFECYFKSFDVPYGIGTIIYPRVTGAGVTWMSAFPLKQLWPSSRQSATTSRRGRRACVCPRPVTSCDVERDRTTS